jgi:thiamine biosynthesis lipoprotein
VSDTGRVEFHALGTGCVLLSTDPATIDTALACVVAELDQIDRACSRFREDSELTALNHAAGHPFAASALLLDAIDVSLRAARLTEGDLDPTVGSTMRALGYDRDFGQVPRASGGVLTVHAVRDWRRIRVDRDAMTVTSPVGAEIERGATAKAWAADRAAAAAARTVNRGILLSLGGDIATAGPAPAAGWPVRIADSHAAAADAPGVTITITSGGLATSSTTVRRWTRGGVVLHHIVDPATGLPAPEVWRTASVAAAACVDANIASTTSVIRGTRAIGWLREMRLPARLVHVDGRVVTGNGWPPDSPIL